MCSTCFPLKRGVTCSSAAARAADLQQEGEAGVAVRYMLAAPVLRVHEAHDDLPQHREADVDAARLLQALAGGTRLLLPLRACACIFRGLMSKGL